MKKLNDEEAEQYTKHNDSPFVQTLLNLLRVGAVEAFWDDDKQDVVFKYREPDEAEKKLDTLILETLKRIQNDQAYAYSAEGVAIKLNKQTEMIEPRLEILSYRGELGKSVVNNVCYYAFKEDKKV